MKRAGFTLIEIMVVTVIIGVLVLIAIPQVTKIKEKSIVTSMVSELRNLQLSQEAFYTKNLEYASSIAELTDFQQSEGIAIQFQEDNKAGWTAQTAHQATAVQCAVFVGRLSAVTPLPPAAEEAIIACTDGS